MHEFQYPFRVMEITAHTSYPLVDKFRFITQKLTNNTHIYLYNLNGHAQHRDEKIIDHAYNHAHQYLRHAQL